MSLFFNKNFVPSYHIPFKLSPLTHRLTAPNANAYTFKGTNSYFIGKEKIALLDPGPDEKSHYQNILKWLGTKKLQYILLTHNHADHSALAPKLAHHYQIPILCAALPKVLNNTIHYIPIKDGEKIATEEWSLQAISTPGHSIDHYCFALEQEHILFTGDHIMGWATSLVAPDPGAMAAYMHSLEKLLHRPQDILYLPGHGDSIKNPQNFTRALKTHRILRERAILERLHHKDTKIEQIKAALYPHTDAALTQPILSSIYAHLLHLVEKGKVYIEGPQSPHSQFYIKE